MTAWRCMWVMTFCVLTSVIQAGGVGTLAKLISSHSRQLSMVAFCNSLTSIGFPLSLQLTGSAEALLLLSLNPLWGALIGWRFLGDTLPQRTLWALVGALVSIGLIFAPHVVGSDVGELHRPNRLAGNVMAIITGIGLGGYGNAVRYISRTHPNTPFQAAQILSNVNAVVFCLGGVAVSGQTFAIQQPGRIWWVTCAMGFIINTAYLGFNVAPRYIKAAEFGIICLLEAVLGPIWVYLVIGEVPSVWTLAGGGTLLGTMVAHELASMMSASPATPQSVVSLPGTLKPALPDAFSLEAPAEDVGRMVVETPAVSVSAVDKHRPGMTVAADDTVDVQSSTRQTPV